MTVSVRSILAELPEDRRKKVQAQAAEIVAEATTLSALRKARKFTQAQIASAMETSQANIAQIEKKSDVLVSTISRVVNAMGGELELIARFDDGQSVALLLGADGQVRPRSTDLGIKTSSYVYKKESFVPEENYWKLPKYLTSKLEELGKNLHGDLKHSNALEYKATVWSNDASIEKYYLKGKVNKHISDDIIEVMQRRISINHRAA